MDSDLEIVAHPTAAASPDAENVDATETAVVPPKRRAPRKPSKPDAVLAAAVEFARSGVLQVAEPGQVGDHVGAYPDAERVVTHRFVAHLPGYGGWHWFATLARVPRGKEPTISEVGLLPSDISLLSPPWVPWAERVRPEDSAKDEGAQEETAKEVTAAEAVVAQAVATEGSIHEESTSDDSASNNSATDDSATDDSATDDSVTDESASPNATGGE